MDTTDLKGRLREYIKHLCRARNKIEKEEDLQMAEMHPAHPLSMSMSASSSEFVTLSVVIKDLEALAYPKGFSYWDS